MFKSILYKKFLLWINCKITIFADHEINRLKFQHNINDVIEMKSYLAKSKKELELEIRGK